MSNDSNYFVGQGKVALRLLNDNGTPNGNFEDVGDADEFMTDASVSKNNHYESLSGSRSKVATWNTQTDTTFSLSVKNFSLSNIAKLVAGTSTGAVAGATVLDEVVTIAAGSSGLVYTEFPEISAVSVVDGDGITALVEGTDYDIEVVGGITGFGGGIRILPGAVNFTGPNIEVSYTHQGLQAKMSAIVTPLREYEIRFAAVNMTATNTPVIVFVPRAQFNISESISWLGTDIADFTVQGDILVPVGGGAPWTVTQGT